MSSPKPHYRAFISYSHKDAKWAKWLHRSLERYVVPIDAYPQEEKREKDGSKRNRRLTPVFRDRDELSVSGSLADAIRVALEASENLIVLCSPGSAESLYVNAEIDLFRELHPDNEKKIYALIIEGEPPDCFPPALIAGGVEPIAADAREVGDGKADAKLKLIAGILGVGFDRLKRRRAKRQRNRLLVMVALVSAVAVMTTALAVRATRAEHKANIQEKASRARVLAVTEPVKALALALDTAEEEQALKGAVSAPVMSSLLHTLETGRETARYTSLGGGHQVTDCVPSPDGNSIAYTTAIGVFVVDRSSGLSREIFRPSEGGVVRKIAFGKASCWRWEMTRGGFLCYVSTGRNYCGNAKPMKVQSMA
ncbi:MAG: toll/interleukin-1 receptor domain-containing protein [Verrucomicrobia bacterium]|nr:toll/interleukin-1 receptor domain-containing protein [Verrucomicrobiota bacterium]